MSETVRAQSAVPGGAASPPVTQPQDPGDEPLADICIVGGPPDSGFKLSVPATPAMLDAAKTRALRRQLLPEDGIGIGVGPDGMVHIVHSYTVQLTSGYGPLVGWDVWVKLERNALGGPTFTTLTYQQQRINERFNRTRDIQQRWENGIYWTGQMGQMLVLGKAGAAGRALPGSVAGSAPTIHSIVPPLTPSTTAARPVAYAQPATKRAGERWSENRQAGGLFPWRRHKRSPSQQKPTSTPLSEKERQFVQDTAALLENGQPAPLPRGYGSSRVLSELTLMRAPWGGVYRQADGSRVLMDGPTPDTTRLILLKSRPSGLSGIYPFDITQVFQIHGLGGNRVRMLGSNDRGEWSITTVDISHGEYYNVAMRYIFESVKGAAREQ